MEDRRRIIGVDIDDVLADFVSDFMKVAARKFGVNPELRPVDWNWSNLGLDAGQIGDIWEEIRKTRNFWLHLEASKDTELVERAASTDLLYFITTRFPTKGLHPEIQTATWLARKFGIEFPTVIVSGNKGEIADALDLTHFIDDRPENCDRVKDAIPTCHVYLKDTSHNKDYNREGIIRVKSFDEFYGGL
jgi:5'(3')-deoxyribonucleotidase